MKGVWERVGGAIGALDIGKPSVKTVNTEHWRERTCTITACIILK